MSTAVFEFTAGELIERALIDARIISANQPIQGKDTNNGLVALKFIFKHFQAQGLHLWAKEKAILPLNTGQRKYFLGPNGADAAKVDSFVNTTLTANEIAAATVIDVTSSTGMEGAPNILATNPALTTQDWTAIDSATLSISSNKLVVTNGAAVAGGAEFDLTTVVGDDYLISFSYEKGTSASADFTASDVNGTLDTVNLSATGLGTLTFTATDTTTVFTIANNSAVITETSLLVSMNYVNKAAGDRIGIALDDGTRFWDDIVTVDSGIQVTINAGLPSAASGSTSTLNVFSYSEEIERPLRILNSQFGETITASEIPVAIWSQEEYADQPDKDSSGTVINIYYSPQLNEGELEVWQVASNINQVLRFTYERPLLIPTASTDVLDFPSEWIMALKWAIAAELGPQYGVKAERQIVLEAKAAQTLEEVLGHDVERDSMSLQPDLT